MTFDVSSIASTPPRFSAESVRRVTPPSGGTDAATRNHDVVVDTLPASPPPDAMAEVERAAKRYEELHAMGRELRFSAGAHGRISVEVRNLDGEVLRRIPTVEAVEIARGKPVE